MAIDNKKKGSYFQGPNNVFYYIEIILYNKINNRPPTYIPFYFVDILNIYETIFSWVTKGEITFTSEFEILYRGSPLVNKDDVNDVPYIDRTDGRNRLHIKIRPVSVTLTDGNISEDADTETKFPSEYWEIDYDFVIVDAQDISTGNNQRKKRMYVLVDEKEQIIKEKNIEWSSESIAAQKLGIDPSVNLPDKNHALNPNDVLKDLLSIISTNGDTMPKINIGYDKNGNIETPNIPLDKIQLNNWDIGDLSNLVTFYPNANSNTNAYDNINYVLSHCMSYDRFPVILSYGRSSVNKGWQLNSLSYYFEKAEPEQVEALIIEDSLNNLDIEGGNLNTPHIPRSPTGTKNNTTNFMSIEASRIREYKYAPMVALDDNRILNSPYCYYNEYTGGFSLKKEVNSVQTVVQKLNELAQKGLYSFKGGSSYGPQIILTVNKTKSTGQMTKNHLSLNGPYSNQQAPLNQMILDAIFLNQSLSFQSMGLTIRTPGKFISVEKISSGERNPFDDRFLGQWFVTNVTHSFTQEQYITEVTANKIDSFSSIFPVDIPDY